MKNTINKALLVLLTGLIYLSPVPTLQATDFVCSQDLDGNGDVLGSGEHASCSIINSLLFCGVGAQDCVLEQTLKQYECSEDGERYSAQNTCNDNCNSKDIDHGAISASQMPASCNVVEVSNANPNLNPNPNANYICPTLGSACVDIAGRQKCSVNPCVNLDLLDNSDTITAPELEPATADNGNRDENGVCTDRVLLFDGKSMRCRYKGWFGLADNCCHSSGQVLSDSTGSYLTNMTTSIALSASWQVLSAGYSAFTAELAIANSAGVEFAATQAQWAAQGALESFAIDPATLAISIAIKAFTAMMGCERVEQEATIYKGSGYCHQVGSFCSKKIPLLGCVEKSKGMCCFNSKLARIIQQQGREQLAIDWGDPKSPSCGGFSPEQFQALDFNRIDMSEYYGDIKSRGESLIQEGITEHVEGYYNKISP